MPSIKRVWFRFMRLHQHLYTAMTLRLRDMGLSVPQFDLISTLSEEQGITQRELAEKLYVTKGNVSGLIDRLVEAGMVIRKSAPSDKRSHALFLTPLGEETAQKGITMHEAFMNETLGQQKNEDLFALEKLLGNWRDAARTSYGADGNRKTK